MPQETLDRPRKNRDRNAWCSTDSNVAVFVRGEARRHASDAVKAGEAMMNLAMEIACFRRWRQRATVADKQWKTDLSFQFCQNPADRGLERAQLFRRLARGAGFMMA